MEVMMWLRRRGGVGRHRSYQLPRNHKTRTRRERESEIKYSCFVGFYIYKVAMGGTPLFAVEAKRTRCCRGSYLGFLNQLLLPPPRTRMYPPPHPHGYDKHMAGVPVPAPPPGVPVSPRGLHQHYASPYPAVGMQGTRLPDGSTPWTTGLCHCCDDPANCLITSVCPCITFGQIAEIVDRGNTSCAASGAAYGLLGLTGLACLYSCFYRGRLRGQYNLEEAPTHDCLVHFCCEACALCQEYRELRNRGFDMGIGWQANIDRQSRVVSIAPTIGGAMMR